MLRLSSTLFFNNKPSLVVVILAVSFMTFLPRIATASPPCKGCGWFWYEKDKPAPKKASDRKPSSRPEPQAERIEYTPQQLWDMSPARFKKVLDDTLDIAMRTLSLKDVGRYLRYQKIAKDKAVAFSNVAMFLGRQPQYISSERDYPLAASGRKAIIKKRQAEIRNTILGAKDDFALIYFYAPDCSFCAAQNGALKYFMDKYSWEVKPVNVDDRPDVAARFNVTTTPTLLLVYRANGKYMLVSSGVAAVSEIETRTFQGVRLLRGDITPQQLSMYDFQRGGYFDPHSSLFQSSPGPEVGSNLLKIKANH